MSGQWSSPGGAPMASAWVGGGAHGELRRPGDHGADAGVGEQLEQQHVRDAAVEEVGRADAAVDGVEAGRDLGDHPAGQRAVGDERSRARRPTMRRDEAVGVVDVARAGPATSVR